MSVQAAIISDEEVQEFRSPLGEKMYILPETQYKKLVERAEDAADIAAVMKFERKLAAGEEELIPASIADRLIDGENPLKVWREYRGFSVKSLAAQAGISPSYLSQLESGGKNGTIETYKKLAKALSLTVDDLI